MTREQQQNAQNNRFDWLTKPGQQFTVPAYYIPGGSNAEFDAYLARRIASNAGAGREGAFFRRLKRIVLEQSARQYGAPDRVGAHNTRRETERYMRSLREAQELQTKEVRTALLAADRAKAALAYSDELYGTRRKETGLSSAEQYLAAKQQRREQQAK